MEKQKPTFVTSIVSQNIEYAEVELRAIMAKKIELIHFTQYFHPKLNQVVTTLIYKSEYPIS